MESNHMRDTWWSLKILTEVPFWTYGQDATFFEAHFTVQNCKQQLYTTIEHK